MFYNWIDNKTEWDSTTCQCVHPEETTPCGSAKCPVPHDTCTQYECNEEQSTCMMTTSPDGAACGVTGSDPSTWDMCRWRCETGVCRYDEVSCDAEATAMGMTLQQADPFTCDQVCWDSCHFANTNQFIWWIDLTGIINLIIDKKYFNFQTKKKIILLFNTVHSFMSLHFLPGFGPNSHRPFLGLQPN